MMILRPRKSTHDLFSPQSMHGSVGDGIPLRLLNLLIRKGEQKDSANEWQ